MCGKGYIYKKYYLYVEEILPVEGDMSIKNRLCIKG